MEAEYRPLCREAQGGGEEAFFVLEESWALRTQKGKRTLVLERGLLELRGGAADPWSWPQGLGRLGGRGAFLSCFL